MKRILLVTAGLPVPGSGTSERTRTIYRALCKFADTRIYQFKLCEPHEETTWYWRKRKYLLQDFRPDKRLFREVSALHSQHRFDAFFCRYYSATLTGCDQLGPALLDYDDLPEVVPGPPVPGWSRIGWALTRHRLRNFRTVFVTKQADIARIDHCDVQVLPCASAAAPLIDSPMSPPPESKTILFVGSYRWPPNRDGVTRFVQHILPRIRQQVPTATLRFVGEDSQLLDGIDGVSGAGFVEDLVAEYRNAALVVCPIYSGAGANVKLAEAALFGKAIVATSHAARGFEGMLEPERDLLVADTDETITAACIRLLQDEHVRTELERNSLRAAAEHLSQPAIDRIVGNALERCW